jgi:hypothetical protein
VVAAFEAILAGASEDYRLGRGPAFVLHSFGGEDVTESLDARLIDRLEEIALVAAT